MLGKFEGKRRRDRQRMRQLDGLNGHEPEHTLGDGEGQGSLGATKARLSRQAPIWTTACSSALARCLAPSITDDGAAGGRFPIRLRSGSLGGFLPGLRRETKFILE